MEERGCLGGVGEGLGRGGGGGEGVGEGRLGGVRGRVDWLGWKRRISERCGRESVVALAGWPLGASEGGSMAEAVSNRRACRVRSVRAGASYTNSYAKWLSA